jgi:uroporphyrinogen decarboxylase
MLLDAFRNTGYDFAITRGSAFNFETHRRKERTTSLNFGALILGRETMDQYSWPDPDGYDYSLLERLQQYIPEGMKLVVTGLGVLESVIALTGFDNLCYMLADDPELAKQIFDNVGSRIVRHYEICSPFPAVGALVSNDDWGFNTQTLLSVKDLRKYVFPWHKKIVEAIHKCGKPVILHSCGNLDLVMEDVIEDMMYDGKHSYEDKITPMEEAYDKWGDRIAIIGGIDIDYICRSAPQEIFHRSAEMLERSREKGSYALGTGNSVPYYIPIQNFLAMISAAI